MLIFSSVWLLFELTRMPLHYLPYRYLLGFIFASGAILSTVYSEWTYHYGKLQYLFFTLAIIIAFFNLKNNYDAYNRRTFQLGAINNYLADYNLKDKPVLGSWASTVCWKNKAIVLPVWYKYYNWIDPIKKFNPALVVTELDESDSNEAYKNEGIDLNKISDSCRVFDVWNYKLVLYWIKSMKEIRPN